jgi:hypothetical protein
VRRRHLERDSGFADLALGAAEPLAHGLEWQQERAGDLLGREPAERTQRQRHLRLEGECGMAAGEDQLQAFVGERCGVVHRVLRRVGQFPTDLLGLRGKRPVAAYAVDRAVAGRRDQPAGGVLGFSVARPALRGEGERLLRGVLGKFDVAERANEGGEYPSPLIPEDLLKHPRAPARARAGPRSPLSCRALGGRRRRPRRRRGSRRRSESSRRGTPCCRGTGRR